MTQSLCEFKTKTVLNHLTTDNDGRHGSRHIGKIGGQLAGYWPKEKWTVLNIDLQENMKIKCSVNHKNMITRRPSMDDVAAKTASEVLEHAKMTSFAAKDIFRASGLSLLGISISIPP